MDTAVPILVYHSVDTKCADAYRRWMILPAEFERQMRCIRDGGFRPVTVSALSSMVTEGRTIPPKTVVITFDDGLRDFKTGALPVLRDYGFPATLYVVSGYMGKVAGWLGSVGEASRPMLSWSELRDIAAEGIEIGAHTVSHPQLDTLSASDCREEIAGSKDVIEDNLGQPVRSFAYPHGYSNRTARRLVAEAGFDSACRVRHAIASTAEDRFALSRVVMTSDVGEDELGQILCGQGLPVGPPIDSIKSKGWRLARRLIHLSRRFGRRNAEINGNTPPPTSAWSGGG